MTVNDVWKVSACHVFIRNEDGSLTEYKGDDEIGKKKICFIKSASYPMYEHVIEIELPW